MTEVAFDCAQYNDDARTSVHVSMCLCVYGLFNVNAQIRTAAEHKN